MSDFIDEFDAFLGLTGTPMMFTFSGRQGGTVHQIGQETGIDTTGFIYDPADLLNDDYLAGWNAGYEHDRQKAGKNKGNVQFWIGVADGWNFKKRTEA